MINFHFLQKIGLKFINEILQEDVPFGILLFLQARSIYVYPKEMIIYRLRAGSIMDFAGKNKKVAQYFRKQTEVFELEEDKRAYHLASSFVKMTLVLDEYLQKCDGETRSIISHYLMPTYVSQALQILNFKKDPLNLVRECVKIQKYIKENGAA
ncbi:glycosyltransferase family 2 protein, partial [Campylobacter upsaliensis]